MSTSMGLLVAGTPLGVDGPAAAEELAAPLMGERDMLRRCPLGGPDGGLLGKEGQLAAARPQRAAQCVPSAGHKMMAQAAEAPWQSGPRTWQPDTSRTPVAHTLALAPWPAKSACRQRRGMGLHPSGTPPPWAVVFEMTAHTSPHNVGWCILLGVGAPSHAPVPRHFHGHHLRTLTVLKSSESPPASEPTLGPPSGEDRELFVQNLGVGPPLGSGAAP